MTAADLEFRERAARIRGKRRERQDDDDGNDRTPPDEPDAGEPALIR
jgi:hypothetical protein